MTTSSGTFGAMAGKRRVSFSIDEFRLELVQAAADRAGKPLSAWLAAAAVSEAVRQGAPPEKEWDEAPPPSPTTPSSPHPRRCSVRRGELYTYVRPATPTTRRTVVVSLRRRHHPSDTRLGARSRAARGRSEDCWSGGDGRCYAAPGRLYGRGWGRVALDL